MLRNIGINTIRSFKINTSNVNRLNSLRFNSSSSTSSMNWSQYLNLKKQNQRLNTAAGIVTGITGSLLTLTYIGNIEIDVEKPIMGLDPIMVFAGGVILGGAFGYALGPFLGTFVFNLKNKAVISQYKLKDKDFLLKIKKNRVDPSAQSFSNPVPDYYGEKIFSLKDYRQWLRDCNAFRRKAKEFL